MTTAPSATKVSAIARPMPWPAAVISATLPCSLVLMFALRLLAVQCREIEFLPAFAIEILRRKPALEIVLARRPLAVEHGEPSIIAVAALGDDVLAECTFIDKAVA